MSDYQSTLRNVDDEEVLHRALGLALVADRIDPSVVAERMEILLAEIERRGCLSDPDLADYRKPISDAAHRSSHPALADLARKIGLRKSRAVRFNCPLCFRPRVRIGEVYCDTCTGFIVQALGVHGTFDANFKDMAGLAPLVRGQGPICYLCGEEPTDHAEHVIPIIRGGKNRLSNLGGACWRCNVSKGDRILEPTSHQKVRLAAQQAATREALAEIDVDAFWTRYMLQNWNWTIDEAVDDLADDYPDVGRVNLPG